MKSSSFFRWGGWRTEGDTRAPPELIFMFPHSGAAEAPKDQVMIQVVPGVPDGHVHKDTMVCLQDIVRLVPHLSTHPEHDPHSFFLVPGAWVRMEALQNILQFCHC